MKLSYKFSITCLRAEGCCGTICIKSCRNRDEIIDIPCICSCTSGHRKCLMGQKKLFVLKFSFFFLLY